MRDMYHIDGVTDESKVTKDAIEKSTGDSHNDPEDVQLHYHSKTLSCTKHRHVLYRRGHALELSTPLR